MGRVALGAGEVTRGGGGGARLDLHLLLLKVQPRCQHLTLLVRRVLPPGKEVLQLLPLLRAVHRARLPPPPRGHPGRCRAWPKGKTGSDRPHGQSSERQALVSR